jgi:predicted DCC family thiol-disulfide oxidoreductase YuxK
MSKVKTKPDFLQNISRLVLFDGVCNLCNRNMLFLIRNDPLKKLTFCSVQSQAGQVILKWLDLPLDVHESIVFLENDTVYEKSDAILHIAYHLPWYLRWLYIGKILPRLVRDNVYLLVARNRYRLFGRRSVCAVPTPDILNRFISISEPAPNSSRD